MERTLAVSVVVPVLDQPDGLAATLRALDVQTLPRSSYEVIVVDNGSGEAALRAVEQSCASRSSVRLLVEHEIRSSYAARNRGVEAAAGAAIAFTDADCQPEPRWLDQGLTALDAAGADVVAGRIVIAFRGDRPNVWEYLDAASWLDQRHYVDAHGFGATANLFVQRELFEAVGTFRSDLISGGDYEFGRRVAHHGGRVVYAEQAAVVHPARSSARASLVKAKRVSRGLQSLERLGLLEHNRLSWRHVMPVRRVPAVAGHRLGFGQRVVVGALANALKYWSLTWRLL